MNKKVLTDDKLNRLLKSLRAVYASLSKEAEVLSVGFARYADRGTSPERVRRNGSKVEGKTVAYFGRLDALLEHLCLPHRFRPSVRRVRKSTGVRNDSRFAHRNLSCPVALSLGHF